MMNDNGPAKRAGGSMSAYPAVVLAIMALGLALGPQLPGLLGHPEAIWGRGASLLAASLPLVLLMLPRGKDDTWVSFAVIGPLVAVIAGSAFLDQWQTSLVPTPMEITEARSIYVAAYIGLQALLVLAWLYEAQGQHLRAGDGLVPYVALLGAFLVAIGAGMALIVQVLLPDPNLTGPWQVPVHAQKDVQIGDVGIALLRVGMLVAAVLPLAWWGAQRAREAMRVARPMSLKARRRAEHQG